MAVNEFSTMLHRNTNKITFNLVYAFLEWVLIVLLLLNSLFSYLIVKFADYFGLKRPCLWCSRLDHIFEATKVDTSYRSLVCETHALEISKLGYCSNHRKLAEFHDMCEDCSSSSQSEFSTKFAFFPWMKQLGLAQVVGQNDEASLKCSCCGIGLESKLCCPDYYLVKPSWSDLDDTQKENFVLEHHVDAKGFCDDYSVENRSGFVIDYHEEDHKIDRNGVTLFQNREVETEQNAASIFVGKEVVVDDGDKIHTEIQRELELVEKNGLNVSMEDHIEMFSQVGFTEEICGEIQTKHLEFYIDEDDCHLIPIDLIEQPATEKGSSGMHKKRKERNCENEDFVMEFDKEFGANYELVVEDRSILEEKTPLLPIPEEDEETNFLETELNKLARNENSADDLQECPLKDIFQKFPLTTDVQDALEINIFRECLVTNDVQELSVTDKVQETPATDAQESFVTDDVQELPGTEGQQEGSVMAVLEAVSEEEENQVYSDETEAEISIGTEIPDQELIEDPHSQEPTTCKSAIISDHGAMLAEEDALEFRVRRVENNEGNEIDEDKFPDTPTSIDSFHQIHKKLLLEMKESGAEESLDGSIISDIDASDGDLNMEKLKSALLADRETLNALYADLEEERSASAIAANQTMAMINRLQEEKAAMQMEAFQYQRMMEEQAEYDQEALQLLNKIMVKREKEKTEVEKELEICRKKLHHYEMEKKVDQESCNQNTPADAVLDFEESIASFEDERISILEQLKVLEDKLCMLSDEEDVHFEDIKPIEHFSEENGNGYYHNMNGKHYQERRIIGAKPKKLLPLFDAADIESEDPELDRKYEIDYKKLAIEEEVDHVYERLQALEADREFLRHCITSLRKGDKGVELLQEILHHLRDLRSVELSATNVTDRFV